MVSIIRYNIKDIGDDKFVRDLSLLRFDMYIKIPFLWKTYFSNNRKIEILHSFGELDDHNILALNIGYVNKHSGKIFWNYSNYKIIFYDQTLGHFIKRSYSTKYTLYLAKFPMLKDINFIENFYKKNVR